MADCEENQASKPLKLPKGWPEGVWINSKQVPGDKKADDFETTELVTRLILKNPEFEEAATANLKPHVVEQIKLRVQHADTIARITAAIKKKKRAAAAGPEGATKEKKKDAKLPAKFMTANQQLLADLLNALHSAEETRALIANQADDAVEAGIKSVARFEEHLPAAVADRQAAKPLHDAFTNLFTSLINLPPGPFDDVKTESAARAAWAMDNARAMNQISKQLWGNRLDLRKANKKAQHNADLRKKALKKRLRPDGPAEPQDDEQAAPEKKTRVVSDQEEEYQKEEEESSSE